EELDCSGDSHTEKPFPVLVELSANEPVMNGPTRAAQTTQVRERLGHRWPASNQKVRRRPLMDRTGSLDMGRVADKYKEKPEYMQESSQIDRCNRAQAAPERGTLSQRSGAGRATDETRSLFGAPRPRG